ncbi:hypothetical protein ACFQ3S_04965, partial [Mucilaginibacter terrae]|uniref:hypothetical protein n=1 Tax=Mucilaginibacter terrae TaxID=1955052 RepID=UPI00363AD754
THGSTPENKEFLNWAVEFLMANPGVSLEVFKNPFWGTPSFPIQINLEDLDPITLNDVSFDPNNLDLTNAESLNVDAYTTLYSFNNTDFSENYPDSHPVSITVKNFNEYIWRAFKGANNTSLKNFHETAKGLNASDGYGKGLGAIGEGLFAQRLLSIPSLTRVRAVGGAVVQDNLDLSKRIFIDLLTEQKLPEAQEGYSYINMIYTDVQGNSQNKNLKVQRNSQSRLMGTTMINTGFVAYEVKTYNPSNTEAILFKAFTEGIQQTIQRAYFRNMTAGVLIFDKASFTKIYNSSYHSKIDAILQKVKNMRNINGEQAVFLRLENNLWNDSNNAYHALIDLIKDI